MKITCDRRSDIIKRRQDYDNDYNLRKERAENEQKELRRAEYAIEQAIEDMVISEISDLAALSFDVESSARNYESDKFVRLRVLCNEDNKFDHDNALSWSYQVTLEDGKVKRETSSWSGLQATTPEQIESLRQTLTALERLNNMDWSRLEDLQIPDATDYIKTKDPGPYRGRDFDRELLALDFEETLGKNLLVKSKTRNIWYKLLGISPKRYKLVGVPSNYIDDENARLRVESLSQYPMQKDKTVILDNIVTPIELAEY